MAVLATIWCGLYVYANYFYNDKQIDVENFYIAELPLPPSQFEEDFKEILGYINTLEDKQLKGANGSAK